MKNKQNFRFQTEPFECILYIKVSEKEKTKEAFILKEVVWM